MKAAMAAGLTSAAVPTSAGAAKASSLLGATGDRPRKKPRIMFYNDCRHPAIYMYEPPMEKEQFEAAVDELLGTPVEALMFGLGDGRTVLHRTKVGELWGDPVKKWPHLIFRRAHQNAKMMLESGRDPLRIVCEHAHANGMLIYPSLWLNRGRGENREEDVRAANFTWENQHLEIGAKGDLDEDFPGLRKLDFKHKEVQDERFALIEEVLQNYPVDGFELLFGNSHYFHPKEVDAGREIMTSWVKRVHRAVKASGQDRELTVLVPANMEIARSLGFDLQEWIRRGIVDVISAQTYYQKIDNLADFRPLIEAAKGTSCRIHACTNGIVNSDRVGGGTIEMIRAVASNYWAQGVDGLYLGQWFAGTNWPYQASFYEQLREVAYPQLMAPKDKFYMVPTTDQSRSRSPAPPIPLPVDLKAHQPVRLELPVADDLPRWDRQKRVHEVLLRIRLANNTELDQVTFRFNGKVLPESHLRRINHLYRMHAPRFRVNNSYWYIYRLDRDHWPKQGTNTIEVTLTQRDPDVTPPLQLRDIEIETRYLMGRNYYRSGEDSDLGPAVVSRPWT
jgi:hypothetical protein